MGKLSRSVLDRGATLDEDIARRRGIPDRGASLDADIARHRGITDRGASLDAEIERRRQTNGCAAGNQGAKRRSTAESVFLAQALIKKEDVEAMITRQLAMLRA